MAIENRDLTAGTKLVARYRGQEHSVLVVGDQETGLGFELDNGRIYKSLSSAGKAVMNGVSCNGWRFWSRAGDGATEGGEVAAPAHATKGNPTPKAVRQISKIPNQKGVPEGQTKWFCSACQTSFLVDGKDAPDACPEGHTREIVDDLALVN
jgi:hypothetical protein